MGLRVEDRGESKRRPVMGRIGVATLPHPKGSRLPRGVGGREPSANRRRGRRSYVGRVAMALAGAAAAPCSSTSPPAAPAGAADASCRELTLVRIMHAPGSFWGGAGFDEMK